MYNKAVAGNTMLSIGTFANLFLPHRGFSYFLIYSPEPHILLFRRPLGTDPQTGQVDQELLQLALQEYKDQPGLSHQAIMN